MKTKIIALGAIVLGAVATPVLAQEGTVTGAAGGAVTGAIVGGPVGAAVGGVVGAIAGALFVWAFTVTQNKLKIDDVLGVWPLHGLCGVWGGIACGIFGQQALGGLGGVSLASQTGAAGSCSSPRRAGCRRTLRGI